MAAHAIKDSVAAKSALEKKRKQKKYNLPVIGHFADRSVEFKSILAYGTPSPFISNLPSVNTTG